MTEIIVALITATATLGSAWIAATMDKGKREDEGHGLAPWCPPRETWGPM